MKRAQKILSKKASGDGITGSALLVSLTIILFIALLGLASTPALANGHGWHFKHSRQKHHLQPRACSETASAVFIACQNGNEDDYWIAKANCYNSPKEDQAECFQEAKAEYKDAKAECRDQLEARKDLCDVLGEAPYNPDLDPADFVDDPTTINAGTANPYWPLVPGYKWTYKTRVYDEMGNPGPVIETNTVEVTHDTVMIEGIKCIVVRDIVYEGDQPDPPDPAALSEDTYDWYAQKHDRTVWYMGEFSLAKEAEGLFADDGSWQAGFDGGEGGVIMFGDPSAVDDGTVYRQELYVGEAEDAAQKIQISNDPVTVLYTPGVDTTFNENVLKNYEFSVLEPGVGENKYYAPGVGLLVEEALEDGEPTGEVNELWYTNVPMP